MTGTSTDEEYSESDEFERVLLDWGKKKEKEKIAGIDKWHEFVALSRTKS